MNRRRAAVLLGAASVLIFMNACDLKPGGSAPAVSSPQIELPPGNAQIFELPNGLRLIVEEDASSPVVSVQAWCETGSITEGKHLGSGISHILEHMLFKGTSRRGNSEIAQTIQANGGYINAYTSFDRTVYFIDAPSAGWKPILDVLADAIFHSTLPVEEYTKEQEVIRREFAMGFDDPNRTLQKLLFETAFTRHPFRYPVIGHLEVYNQLTREDVLAYYKKHYVPNNLTFVVVGDVNAEEVRAELERLTASLTRVAYEPTLYPQEPTQLGRREAHRDFPTDIRRMTLAWHIPGITHPDIYALDVAAIIAGDGTSSRLHQLLVEKEKLLRSVSVFSYTPKDSGLWAVAAVFLPGETDERARVESLILEEINRLQSTPVSPAELAKAKRRVLVDRASELKTVAGKAASLGGSWLIARDLDFDQSYLKGIEAVTAADIERVLRSHLTPQNLTVVSLNPPAAPKASSKTSTPTPSSPLTKHTLTNGAVLVAVDDAKVPLATVRVSFLGGILRENGANNGIGNLATRLIDKGTTTRTAEQIANEIETLGGSIEKLFGSNSLSVGIEVLSGDLPAAIELLADITLRPSFPEDEIEKERTKQLSDLKIEKDQPLSLARNELRSRLFGLHPYALNPLGTETSLASLDRRALQAYHAAQLDPKKIVFSIGGSADVETVARLIEKYFPASQLTSQDAFVLPGEPPWSPTALPVVIPTAKQQAIVMIGYPGTTVASPDRAALELADEALSDLASRLFIRIREKQSLAYFVGTSQIAGLERGMFLFYAGTEATKAEKVRTEILDEIAQIASKGLSGAEIERARAKLNGKRLLQDQASSTIAFKAALNELYGLGVDYEARHSERVRTITAQEVNAVLQRAFAPTVAQVTVLVQPVAK
jgi:zinc protease